MIPTLLELNAIGVTAKADYKNERYRETVKKAFKSDEFQRHKDVIKTPQGEDVLVAFNYTVLSGVYGTKAELLARKTLQFGTLILEVDPNIIPLEGKRGQQELIVERITRAVNRPGATAWHPIGVVVRPTAYKIA
jgi:hypothetical protein